MRGFKVLMVACFAALAVGWLIAGPPAEAVAEPAAPAGYDVPVGGGVPRVEPQFGWVGPKVAAQAVYETSSRPRHWDEAPLLYREAYHVARDERRPLLVIAGPHAEALAAAAAAEPNAVVALGEPGTFPTSGVYRYHWDESAGELRGGAVPQAATSGRSGPVRWRCQGGVCTPY